MSVKALTSRDNPLLARLRRLVADPGGYRRDAEVWIEGVHLCGAYAEHGGRATQALITDTAWQVPALHALAERAAAVAVVPARWMADLSALESPPPLGYIVAWPGDRAIAPGLPTLVLDRLQDAGNVGTILRSAAAFGFGQVVALQGTAALWSPKVLRAGMGAHFGLRLVERVDEAALDALGLPLLAADAHADQRLDQAALPWPCAWLLGHEGQGVCATLKARCSARLRIPQPGGEESLNVAAAAAVCCYESMRQRSAR